MVHTISAVVQSLVDSRDLLLVVREVLLSAGSFLWKLNCPTGVGRCSFTSERMIGIRLSLDVGQQMLLVLLEERVLEGLIVRSFLLSLVEVIHVQLADERREVVVLEVLRQDLFGKRDRVPYGESVTIWGRPVRNMVRPWIVDDLVKFDQKGGHMVDGIWHDLLLLNGYSR